ncbi:MAG: HD-GYP domain-containing protein [Acidimicrobiia bacterium]|nr:HD-GYP domain-containing protein [Acidimicrobiia bacterium]
MNQQNIAREQRVRVRFAVAFVLLGAGILAWLLLPGDLPNPLWLLVVLGVIGAYVEWTAVEVNDHLMISSSALVQITSAVIFASSEPVVAVALIAAVSPFQPADFRERRWFQPAVNFGQLVASATAAALVFAAIAPNAAPSPNTVPQFVLAAVVASVVHGVLNYILVQFIFTSVYGRQQVKQWSNMLSIMLPYLGTGVLAALLGSAYHLIGAETLPLIFVVFFVSQMTFVSYSRLREAQDSTLRGFVKALEAKDLYTRGHTERVAYFSELIGTKMGFNGTRLERLRWAALIHDVGKLAVPRDLIRKRARLSGEEYEQMQKHVHLVEDLLAEVDFLQPMVEIAAHHHAHFDGKGYHGGHEHPGVPSLEARILAVADSFDAMTSTRSYRVALSQEYAFRELRRHGGTQFDPEVVEALIEILESRGETYGSPDVDSEEEARERAEGIRLDG